MTPRHTAPARAGTARHARTRRRHPVRHLTALVVVAALSFGATGAATAYVRLQNNIESADVEHLLGDDRPPAPVAPTDPDDPNQGVPVNILVMGSDLRAGSEEIAADDTQGQRSDTTIVVHLSADRERMDLVSIPRDSLVDIPDCLRSDGTASEPRSDTMFNAAFAIGAQSGLTSDAAACTQKTVEHNTGVRIDHFVVVDLAGFATMVDALGGIPICIPQDIHAPEANNLRLDAGVHRLDGITAANYARARTGQGLGNGSDTNRIGRQQELIAATAREVLSKNLLTDVPELIRFLNAATRSLTVSSDLSAITDMTGLAYSLRTVDSGSITLMTIPFATAPSDPNRVVWTEEADAVWAALAADEPLVAEPEAPAPGQTPLPGETPPAGETPETPSPDETPAHGTPSPVQTVQPGVDPFTPDDVTAVCG